MNYPRKRLLVLLPLLGIVLGFAGCKSAPTDEGANPAMTEQQKALLKKHKDKQDQTN